MGLSLQIGPSLGCSGASNLTEVGVAGSSTWAGESSLRTARVAAPSTSSNAATMKYRMGSVTR